MPRSIWPGHFLLWFYFTFFILALETSYKATDAAIPAFKDSVSLAMGMERIASQFS
jgi:hypothetical protein